jgi:hypothetical protein
MRWQAVLPLAETSMFVVVIPPQGMPVATIIQVGSLGEFFFSSVRCE